MTSWLLSVVAAILGGLAAAGFVRGRRVPPSAPTVRAGAGAGASAGAGARAGDRSNQVRPAWARAGRDPGLTGLLRGRHDAPAMSRRVVVATLPAAAVTLALDGAVALPGWASWSAVPVLAAAGALALGLLEPASSRHRLHRLVMDTPQALEMLAGCLAAGMPTRTATGAVVAVFDGPLTEDLGSVLLAIDIGLSEATAWRALAGHPQLGEVALDLARSVDSGAMMVETLTHYAHEARQRRSAAIEVAARSVGVRSVVPMMTCFIPAFILLGIVPTVISAFLQAVPRLV